ncbi:unnamed protein product [Lampetra planeri]
MECFTVFFRNARQASCGERSPVSVHRFLFTSKSSCPDLSADDSRQVWATPQQSTLEAASRVHRRGTKQRREHPRAEMRRDPRCVVVQEEWGLLLPRSITVD